MPRVDVVVVSYNSSSTLRACVNALADLDDARVIVADNASTDSSLETIADLDVEVVPLAKNRGFAFGCNSGAAAGSAPFVLFLNPDASIDPKGLAWLLDRIQSSSSIGVVAPRINEQNGALQYSLRRFPRLTSTFARALFLHRLLPRFHWVDEVVRDPAAYDSVGAREWVSGACMLVRRAAFEELGGFDDGFFMYCEDTDLCLRLRQAGYEIVFDPRPVVVHSGGVSAPRASLLPTLAASRIRFARKHHSALWTVLEQLGLLLEAIARVAVGRGGVRLGYLRSIPIILLAGRATT